MQGGAIKLALMLAIGILLIEIGITGKLGSMIGAIIDPANMSESSGNGFNSSSSSSGSSSGNAQTSFSSASKDTLTRQIQQTFGPYASAAMSIAVAESSMNPNAYNSISVGGSHAEGLFQILYPSTWNTTSQARNNPYDPVANTKAAYEIFVRDGFSWREWATAPALGL